MELSALVPKHYFTALCQLEKCRTKLGGLHFTAPGGMALLPCHKCHHVSLFRNESYGIASYLLDVGGRVLDPKTGRPPQGAKSP